MTNVAEKFARKRLTGNLRMFVWLVSLQLVSLVGSVVADDNCVEANELVQRAVQSAEGGRAELEVYDQALAKCPNMPKHTTIGASYF